MKKLLPLTLSILLCVSIAVSYTSAQTASKSSPAQETELDAVEVGDSADTPANIPATFFQKIPDADLDLLTEYMRWEMVLYMEADSVYKENNVYNSLSWIEKMTPDYLSVHLTDVSKLVLKRLDSKKYKDTDLVMSIYTISDDSDTSDSTVKFYTRVNKDTTEIKSLPAKEFLSIPNPTDFFRVEKGSKVSKKELEEAFPFHTVAYSISAEGDTLIGRPTIANYMTREDRERYEPYLVKELRWKWDGKKFKKIEH